MWVEETHGERSDDDDDDDDDDAKYEAPRAAGAFLGVIQTSAT